MSTPQTVTTFAPSTEREWSHLLKSIETLGTQAKKELEVAKIKAIDAHMKVLKDFEDAIACIDKVVLFTTRTINQSVMQIAQARSAIQGVIAALDPKEEEQRQEKAEENPDAKLEDLIPLSEQSQLSYAERKALARIPGNGQR